MHPDPKPKSGKSIQTTHIKENEELLQKQGNDYRVRLLHTDKSSAMSNFSKGIDEICLSAISEKRETRMNSNYQSVLGHSQHLEPTVGEEMESIQTFKALGAS